MRARSMLWAPCLAALFWQGCGDDGGTGGSGGTTNPACEVDARPEDDAQTPPLFTPRWAFRPWISKDISDGADTRAFVAGFQERDIPVGVVVLDSPWETHYNTFVPNPARYPEFGKLVSDLKAEDVRVVLWVTQMINTTSYDLEAGGDAYEGRSPNYDQPETCGWFVSDAAIYPWWKGSGSAIDFFDPMAMRFWHRLQDPLYDLGVAGFKLDFGESYITEFPVSTDAGPKSLQEYSEAYYEDFYRYGAARVGTEEMVTMVRPYDKSYQFQGRFFARPEHAPVAWVGDNRRDYVGMIDALDHIFRSAEAGYVVIGSDLGGYLDRDDGDLTAIIPPDANTFMRWTALAAMTPFMQLHGRANLTPWSHPGDTELVLQNYRYWAKLHDALVPFYYSVAREAQLGNGQRRMIAPLGDETSWTGDWRYLLGDTFLVAPVIDDSGVRNVSFPANGAYYDFYNLGADPVVSGSTLTNVNVSDPTRIPLFLRAGSIVPLDVSDDTFGLGNSASQGYLTVLVLPGPTRSEFIWHSESGPITLAAEQAANLTLSADRLPQPALFRVRYEAAPTAVAAGSPLVAMATRAALDAASAGYHYDATEKALWIKLPASAAAVSVGIQ